MGYPGKFIVRLPFSFLRFPFAALFLLFCCSCQSPKSPRSGPVTVKADFNDQIDLTAIEKHMESFEVVPIAYQKGDEMASVSFKTGTKDRVVVYSRKYRALFFIDYQGRIIKKLSKSGKGPGEYNDVADMTINPEGNLVLLDSFKKILLEYTLDGEFVREMKFTGDYENLIFLGRDRLLLGSSRNIATIENPGYYIEIVNRELKPEGHLFPFYTPWPMGGNPPVLSVMEKGLGITRLADYHYLFLDEKCKLDTLLVFDFGTNGYSFSGSDRMPFDDYLQILGQNMAKPISAGSIYAQKSKYLVTNFFKGLAYSAVGAWDQESITFHPSIDFKIMGSYKGFPIPNPREMINGKISGTLDAIDILDFWEKYPGEKARALNEPAFREIAGKLDGDDNPVLFFFTLNDKRIKADQSELR